MCRMKWHLVLLVFVATVLCCRSCRQSPDKDYDEQPQTWLPLSFDEHGGVLPMQYVDTFTLDVAV